MDIQGSLTFDSVGRGTHLQWSWILKPRGIFKLFAPMVAMLGQLFAKFSIDISEDLLDHLIEAAVQTINTEAGKFGPIVEIGEATAGG
jgi:hypothetical protein